MYRYRFLAIPPPRPRASAQQIFMDLRNLTDSFVSYINAVVRSVPIFDWFAPSLIFAFTNNIWPSLNFILLENSGVLKDMCTNFRHYWLCPGNLLFTIEPIVVQFQADASIFIVLAFIFLFFILLRT